MCLNLDHTCDLRSGNYVSVRVKAEALDIPGQSAFWQVGEQLKQEEFMVNEPSVIL